MIKLPLLHVRQPTKFYTFAIYQCLIVPDHTVEQLWLITVNKVD